MHILKFPNLRHLRAFKEVAERESVSAAASHIHLSQPAVTQAIAGLEKSLGITLFDRQPEGMFLTRPGQDFLVRVQRLFTHLKEGALRATPPAGKRNRLANVDFYKRVSSSQLRALMAIWETGNFSLAAKHVGISQPSIHRAGRDLEKLAGVPFYIASRQGIDLTQAAESFARATRLAAAELQQGLDEITLAKGRDSTEIVVGSMPLSRTSILPQALDALMRENEGVQVSTVEGPYNKLLMGLRYGDLDFLIGALRDPVPTGDVVQELLFDDPLVIVAGSDHPLSGKKHVTLEDTLDYPWIAPPRESPTGSYLYQIIGIDEMDTTPVRIVSSSLVLVRGLLTRGNFVTIMSMHQMAVECAQGLMVPLNVDLPGSSRSIGLTRRKDWLPTPTQKKFLDLLRAASIVTK